MCVIVSCLLILCQSVENVRLERSSAISVDKLTLSDATATVGRRLGALFRPRRWSMASSCFTMDSLHSFDSSAADDTGHMQMRTQVSNAKARRVSWWRGGRFPRRRWRCCSVGCRRRQLVVPEIGRCIGKVRPAFGKRQSGGGASVFMGQSPLSDRSLS